MSQQQVRPGNGGPHPPREDEDTRRIHDYWQERSRVVLTPVSSPAVLGLFAFGGATWPVAAHLAGWYGGKDSDLFLFEFAALFGGFGQLVAAVWSYRARSALGTGLFGLWGFWWLGWGLMIALDMIHVISLPDKSSPFPEFGFWFITTGIITLAGTVAALRISIGVVLVTLCAGTASLIAAAGYFGGFPTIDNIAGYDFFAAATFAVFTGIAVMLEEHWGRPLLNAGKLRDKRVHEMADEYPIQYDQGMPGSRIGG